jgi:hypothetical protein
MSASDPLGWTGYRSLNPLSQAEQRPVPESRVALCRAAKYRLEQNNIGEIRRDEIYPPVRVCLG